MAETEKNEVLKKSMSEIFTVCQARNHKREGIVASGVSQKESGKSSLLRSVKTRVVQGLGELSFVD